ncbi:MAG: hypothetical protein LIO90_04620 [Bacteroidales bacterium]|nr:hypothetical protein [Bacteroidales bacterium]
MGLPCPSASSVDDFFSIGGFAATPPLAVEATAQKAAEGRRTAKATAARTTPARMATLDF